MNHTHTCPHCEGIKDPKEALDHLQDCFAAIGDLLEVARPNSAVNTDNLAMLFGLLTGLQASALKANQEAFTRLENENRRLKQLSSRGDIAKGENDHA